MRSSVIGFNQIDHFPFGSPNETRKTLLSECHELADGKTMTVHGALLSGITGEGALRSDEAGA